jgi:hypothetical protein
MRPSVRSVDPGRARPWSDETALMPAMSWYARRLSRMGPAEVCARIQDRVLVERRRRRLPPASPVRPGRRGPAALPAGALAAMPASAADRVLAAAEQLLDGRWETFGVRRADLVAPDWWLDPGSGRRAPADQFAFDIGYRDADAVGDIKQIWELSRHHHLTVLAAGWALGRDERCAERVADHLKSWWAGNPPWRGPHWISGIELGVRLIAWVWVRRLLAEWPRVREVFDDNPEALAQIYQHQARLAALPSVGSSANNHVVAEAAGRFVAACAFDWYPESARWRAQSLAALVTALERNTFGSGLNREQAGDYHGLVLELGLVALAEADAARYPVPPRLPGLLTGMADALAAVVDVRLRGPRHGDGDDGQALAFQALGESRTADLLSAAAAAFGPADWWPARPEPDAKAVLLGSLLRTRPVTGPRPTQRPQHFADAGLTVLRAAAPGGGGEVWVRCDGGPHGFGSIAAHAHADALSVEVRIDGVDLLADPGTYCYHTEPQWRAAFRSTRGHNTLELDGVDSSESGGPFLWTRHARSRVLTAHQEPGGRGRWTGEHDGYLRRAGLRHRRTVVLDPAGTLSIRDCVTGGDGQVAAALNFHLGPEIEVELHADRAVLRWLDGGRERGAVLALPAQLSWSAHRGEADPPAGWYSPGFGRKQPAWQLTGTGTASAQTVLTSLLTWRW